MRRFSLLVFEDNVVGTSTVYTSPIHEDVLGTADRHAIQVVADQVSGTLPTITVALEHSGDSRNWAAKNGTAEVNAQTLVTNATNNFTGTEPGTNPSLGRVRLKIFLGGTSPQAHVKIYVTGRDRVP